MMTKSHQTIIKCIHRGLTLCRALCRSTYGHYLTLFSQVHGGSYCLRGFLFRFETRSLEKLRDSLQLTRPGAGSVRGRNLFSKLLAVPADSSWRVQPGLVSVPRLCVVARGEQGCVGQGSRCPRRWAPSRQGPQEVMQAIWVLLFLLPSSLFLLSLIFLSVNLPSLLPSFFSSSPSLLSLL